MKYLIGITLAVCGIAIAVQAGTLTCTKNLFPQVKRIITQKADGTVTLADTLHRNGVEKTVCGPDKIQAVLTGNFILFSGEQTCEDGSNGKIELKFDPATGTLQSEQLAGASYTCQFSQ